MAETRRQREKRLTRERMRLEAQMRKEIQREMNRVVRQYRRDVRATGSESPELLNEHRDRIRQLLIDSYGRTRRRFKGSVTASLQVNPDNLQAFEDLVDTAFDQWKRKTSFTVSGQITATTRKNLVTSVNLARAARQLGLPPMTNAELAANSSEVLRRILTNRAKQIAVSETTNGIETANRAEAEAAAGQVPDIGRGLGLQPAVPPEPAQVMKEWVMMEDELVRPAHVEAHGQRVALSEAFIVGGESLQYPRDTSMGASLGMIINCRCRSRYVKVTK